MRHSPEVTPVITAAKLRSHTVKVLAATAKKKGISGWHEMRKEELVQALIKRVRSEQGQKGKKAANGQPRGNGSVKSTAVAKKSQAGKPKTGSNGGTTQKSTRRSPRVEQRIREIKARMSESKDLAYHSAPGGKEYEKDRIIVMVRDSYWLHAYWEITRQSISRARAALGQHWHGAVPVLRLYELSEEGTANSERIVLRDIQVHGGVNNWYIDVDNPPKGFQIDIGYLTEDGSFLGLARSNVVVTPQSGAAGAEDGNWAGVAKDFDRIYALSGGYDENSNHADLKELFEERLHRPMGSPMVTRFGLGAQSLSRGRRQFPFNVDAELIVHGITDPHAHVTLKGEPVRLEPDGTFSVRLNLPDRRQVLPVVASSSDGVEQQTIVLAVERNTKTMEPIIREPDV
jgi:hypothetical protein